MAWNIVKKDHSYDLADLQLIQLVENLGSMRKAKNSLCMFGSLIVCIFFYVHELVKIHNTMDIYDGTKNLVDVCTKRVTLL